MVKLVSSKVKSQSIPYLLEIRWGSIVSSKVQARIVIYDGYMIAKLA